MKKWGFPAVNKVERPRKTDYYINIAREVATRSTCVDRRMFGALLVRNDTIISAGYNGPVRGAINCGIDIPCFKNQIGQEHNHSYEACPAVHAEMNAIINAARSGFSTLGSTLYIACFKGEGSRPCFFCRRFCINAGIQDCYYADEKGKVIHELISDWIELENEGIKSKEKRT
jgi:dCMP deaminase